MVRFIGLKDEKEKKYEVVVLITLKIIGEKKKTHNIQLTYSIRTSDLTDQENYEEREHRETAWRDFKRG